MDDFSHRRTEGRNAAAGKEQPASGIFFSIMSHPLMGAGMETNRSLTQYDILIFVAFCL